MNKVIALILSAMICITPTYQASADIYYAYEVLSADSFEELFFTPDETADNDILYEGYINTLFYPKEQDVSLFEDRRTGLNLKESLIYEKLKKNIADIASGIISDTQIGIPVGYFEEKTEYSAQEAGLDYIYDSGSGAFNPGLNKFLDSYYSDLKKEITISNIINSLWRDMPYEFYWFDFIKGCSFSLKAPEGSMKYNPEKDTVDIAAVSLVFKFTVSPDFSSGHVMHTYYTDTALTASASASVSNAESVIKAAENLSDTDKLRYYCRKICSLVEYDKNASALSAASGSAWELISVFDNNAETNVVCEGYAKAFKYLCDKTEFADPAVYCSLITGSLLGSSIGHMWNIIHMGDGKNYIVDVTNCDENNPGFPDLLVLKGATPNGDNKYTANIPARKINNTSFDSETVSYVYDDDTLELFSNEELKISESDYPGICSDVDYILIMDEKVADNISADIFLGEKWKLLPVFADTENMASDVNWKSSSDAVSVDGNGFAAADRYGTSEITCNVSGSPVFSVSLHTRFNDVKNDGGNIYNYIYWAADNDIVRGFSDGSFRSESSTTRAQFVIMMWRIAGRPEAEGITKSFSDINENMSYYKAVQWASSYGLVQGFSDGTFRPDDKLTRAQIVIILWRMNGRPEAESGSARSFTDVPSGSIYKPVAWASSNSVVNGYLDGTFRPGADCERRHIATILYRCAAKGYIVLK